MTSSIRARPVTHAGVNYRSVLEARWAIMFEELGWIADYEPAIPLTCYVPDFLVRAPFVREPYARTVAPLVLCEAKPVLCADDYEQPVRKIALSGWEHAAVVLCPTPWRLSEAPEPRWAIGMATDRVERRDARLGGHGAWFPVGIDAAAGFVLGGAGDPRDLWRRAGNLVQWCPPVGGEGA